jgi:hypothetical protein
LALLVAVIGCSGRDSSDRAAVDSLLASYSPEFRIGATVGELERVHSWTFSQPYGGEAFGTTALPRYGAATATVFVDAEGDSVEHADRARAFAFVPDTGDSREAAVARLMQEHASKYLGAGHDLGCTVGSIAPARVWGWDAGRYLVRLYRPEPKTARGTGVRLVIGENGFDSTRVRPCG